MKLIQRMTAAVVFMMMIAASQHAHAQVTGGWSNISTNDDEVEAAADFAVAQHSHTQAVTLKKIVHARKQIVAGTNYEITMRVKVGKKNRKVVVRVWHKPDGSYELTWWKWKK